MTTGFHQVEAGGLQRQAVDREEQHQGGGSGMTVIPTLPDITDVMQAQLAKWRREGK
jgi:hypothetical protein